MDQYSWNENNPTSSKESPSVLRNPDTSSKLTSLNPTNVLLRTFPSCFEKIYFNIVTCGVTIDGGLDLMVRFIEPLFKHLGATRNYSAIANLHILQFTVTHELGFSVISSRILATYL
jgi:hypothetical protein